MLIFLLSINKEFKFLLNVYMMILREMSLVLRVNVLIICIESLY